MTEMVTGLDLIQEQIRVAMGDKLRITQVRAGAGSGGRAEPHTRGRAGWGRAGAVLGSKQPGCRLRSSRLWTCRAVQRDSGADEVCLVGRAEQRRRKYKAPTWPWRLPLAVAQEEVKFNGHAIECRINAEDPFQNFRPGPGAAAGCPRGDAIPWMCALLAERSSMQCAHGTPPSCCPSLSLPCPAHPNPPCSVAPTICPAGRVIGYLPPGGPYVRMDSHLYPDYLVPPNYDSLLGKLIVWAPTREAAIIRMQRALAVSRQMGAAGLWAAVAVLAACPGEQAAARTARKHAAHRRRVCK